MKKCELCDTAGGKLLWQNGLCRVVQVTGAEGAAFPGFCRVVWRAHVQEMSDLTAGERHHLIEIVHGVEAVVRELVRPDKINLASIGNVVPHLHWHVIPRWRNDSHFPAPIWATATRPVPDRPQPAPAALVAALVSRLGGAA